MEQNASPQFRHHVKAVEVHLGLEGAFILCKAAPAKLPHNENVVDFDAALGQQGIHL